MKEKFTLAEIESYFRKVAKVSGLGWGLAEEAGKAARWLAAFDLPGPELMLNHLVSIMGKDYSLMKPQWPQSKNAIWQSSGDSLCPIITGAAVADCVSQMLAGETIKLSRVSYPILLAATIGQAARCHKTVFSTSWAGVELSCHENGIRIEGNRDDLLLAQTDRVSCMQAPVRSAQQLPSTLAYAIDADIWRRVDEFAFKTYAPATELSRVGAGAGLTDND